MAVAKEFMGKIEDLKKRQAEFRTNLNESKTKFNTSMDECIGKVLTGNEYQNDPSYIRYERKNPGATKEAWLDSLSTAEKIDLLVEYGIDAEIDGVNVYEKTLKEAQELKDSTKESIKLDLKDLKEDFKALIDEHNKAIQEIKDLIAKKEDERKEYVNNLAEINKQTKQKSGATNDTTESAKTINEAIKRVDGEIEKYSKRLKVLEKNAKEYESEIKKAIAELEQEFREEGIEINEEVESKKKKEDEQAQQDANNPNIQSVGTISDIDMYSGKPVEVARRMMKDFKNLSPEAIDYVIKYGAYEDLLNMTKDLNLLDQFTFKKRNIRNVMLNRLEDLGGSIDLYTMYGADGKPLGITKTYTIDALLNMGTGKDKNNILDAVSKQINYYMREYQYMTPSKKRQAQETMQMLKMIMVAKESKSGPIRRFFSNTTRKGTRITGLGQTLVDFSNDMSDRDVAAYDKSKELRKMLHVKVDPRKSKVKSGLDASDKTVYQRKNNRGVSR